MISANSPLYRFSACLAVFGVLNLAVPAGVIGTYGPSAVKALTPKEKPAPAKPFETRPLTGKEMKNKQGRIGEQPYIAGGFKWSQTYKGIDTTTGNYSLGASDLSFEGGYGIPVNVTRSYSSNNPDEGPFGKGWTISVDVRTTAGGVLKNSGSPVRSVPVAFKERPSTQDDPNIPAANEPAEAVIATDASGTEETIQKDADGVLTTPAWDKNVIESTYEFVTVNGQRHQVLLSQTMLTPEGTKYTYAKLGTYPNGTKPYYDPNATPEGANVLKITKATDRHGNETVYTYNTSATVTFNKANGVVQENPLTSISMPNGHVITFIWGDGVSCPTNRIWKVHDNNQVRTVTYAYHASGHLWKITTPGGKTTEYNYGSTWAPTWYTGDMPGPLLTSVKDPRGLTTTISYAMSENNLGMFVPAAYRIDHPNGSVTRLVYFWSHDPNLIPPGALFYQVWLATMAIVETQGSETFNSFGFRTWTDTVNTVPVRFVQMEDYFAYSPITQSPYASVKSLKTFHMQSHDLLEEVNYIDPYNKLDLRGARDLMPASFGRHINKVVTVYNFQGNPLKKTLTEQVQSMPNPSYTTTITRTKDAHFAYWGADKYFQQKAVVEFTSNAAPRVSYTDYFDASAAQGSKGQTYRVYSSAFSSFNLPAQGTPSDSSWKYNLAPTSGYALGELTYDSKGRSTLSKKLRNNSTGAYVQTFTVFGSDQSPSWGQAYQVYEDYNGPNQRYTETQSYDSAGRPSRVRDSKGQVYETTHDPDGVVLAIDRVDVVRDIATYTYGNTPNTLENGVLVSVSDNLSGITQNITYVQSGSAIGQVLATSESGPLGGYTVSYTYNQFGDRQTVTYDTPNSDSMWGYYDYLPVGDPSGGGRAFQTLRRVVNNGGTITPTAEEMHYQFDTAGRLTHAAFAQTPEANYTPTGTNVWYDNDHKASKRARAYYEYDPAGRASGLWHWWDSWGGSAYSSLAVKGNAATYESTGLSRGLKTSSKHYSPDPNNSAQFVLDRTETYGYDAQRDFLTSANYADGQPGATPVWTYDAIGNRTTMGSQFDSLNRLVEDNAFSYSHDVLGNRTTRTTKSNSALVTYGWDELNRLTNYQTREYTYRADGLRTRKKLNNASTLYYYDGQMGFQDAERQGASLQTVNTVTNYGLGARGLDFMEGLDGNFQVTFTKFPLYDLHGNMTATLSRSGTAYALADQRSYGAWGELRTGAATGSPSGRYVANLGHRQDDESGLIYMRARYYEPSRGRFISEDPSRDGDNWFSYCEANPVNRVDITGKKPNWASAMITGWFLYFVGNFLRGADKKDWGKFSVALLLMTGLTTLHETGKSETAVRKFALWAHTMFFRDATTDIYGEARHATRSQWVQAFYIGYALSLLFIGAFLDDWVNGD
jgi:RHS repeat-associated protein